MQEVCKKRKAGASALATTVGPVAVTMAETMPAAGAASHTGPDSCRVRARHRRQRRRRRSVPPSVVGEVLGVHADRRRVQLHRRCRCATVCTSRGRCAGAKIHPSMATAPVASTIEGPGRGPSQIQGRDSSRRNGVSSTAATTASPKKRLECLFSRPSPTSAPKSGRRRESLLSTMRAITSAPRPRSGTPIRTVGTGVGERCTRPVSTIRLAGARERRPGCEPGTTPPDGVGFDGRSRRASAPGRRRRCRPSAERSRRRSRPAGDSSGRARARPCHWRP
jgi:hypothetical protein